MNAKVALEAAYAALKKAEKKGLEEIKIRTGEVIDIFEAQEAIDKLIGHIYPEFEMNRFHRIVPCSACKCYKKLRNRKNPRRIKWVCGLDGFEKYPGFYCGLAVSKEEN